MVLILKFTTIEQKISGNFLFTVYKIITEKGEDKCNKSKLTLKEKV